MANIAPVPSAVVKIDLDLITKMVEVLTSVTSVVAVTA